MSATTYDSLAGNADVDVLLAAGSTVGYPSSNLYNVFGPVYLPRVYGKDLSAFEIASSGKVVVTLYDQHALDLDHSSNVTSIAAVPNDSLEISALSGQVKMTLDADSNNLSLTAGSNLIFNAQSIIYNLTGNSESTATGNAALKADGDVVVASTYSNVSVNAAMSNAYVNLNGVNSNLVLFAANDVTATAGDLLQLTGGNGVQVSATGATVKLSSADQSTELRAASNVTLATTAGVARAGTSNDTIYTTWSTATGDLTHTAVSNIVNNADNFRVSAATGVSVVGASATSMTSSTNTLSLSAAASNAMLTLNHTDYSARLFATSNVGVRTANGVAALGDSLDKVGLTASTSTFDLYGFASSNVRFLASNDVRVSALKSMALTSAAGMSFASTGSNVLLTLGADSNLTAQAQAVSITAAQTMDFKINGDSLITVQSDKVIINGGLDIQGTVNSINVTETNLQISDKTVSLAVGAASDGSANNAAGVIVSGMPASASNMDPELAASVYDKSFKWNYGSAGVDALLTNTGIATESFWELHGGRFQLSAHKKADGKPISFALRINELDELEMVKLWEDSNGTAQTRRIAKFGRTLM